MCISAKLSAYEQRDNLTAELLRLGLMLTNQRDNRERTALWIEQEAFIAREVTRTARELDVLETEYFAELQSADRDAKYPATETTRPVQFFALETVLNVPAKESL